MALALTTLRATIATALANPTVWQTFSYPPATILANSVIVAPDSPYLTLSNNQTAADGPLAHFKILMFVPLLDNQGNFIGLETMMVGVFNALAASSLTFKMGDFSAPAVFTGASGDLLTSDLPVSILTTWS